MPQAPRARQETCVEHVYCRRSKLSAAEENPKRSDEVGKEPDFNLLEPVEPSRVLNTLRRSRDATLQPE